MGKRRRKPNFAVANRSVGSAGDDSRFDVPASGAGDESGARDGSADGSVDLATVAGPADSGDGGSGDSAAGGSGERTKRKYTRRTPAANSSVSLTQFVADSLFGLHAFAAGLAGSKTWEMDKDEAQRVAEAITGVTSLYNVPGLSDETVAWAKLAQVLGVSYGLRLLATDFSRSAPRDVTPPAAPKPAPMQSANGPTPGGTIHSVPKPEPQQKQGNAPSRHPTTGEVARPGHIWASPGVGLPMVEVPVS